MVGAVKLEQDPKVQQITDYAALAETAITEHETAVRTLVEASGELVKLERQRATLKSAAILRLCLQDNPATPGKKYSPSQAADFAQLDPEYEKYKGQVETFTLLKQEAEGNLATAKLAAQFAIALVRSAMGAA